MSTTTEVSCPKCGGNMWDNRATKNNPKAPDFKCRDKGCEGVIWPPKDGPRRNAAPAPAKQGFSSGGPLPGEYEDGPPVWNMDEPVPGVRTVTSTSPVPALDTLFNVYDTCFDHAHSLAHRKMGNDASHEGIAAMAATLFIQASKR